MAGARGLQRKRFGRCLICQKLGKAQRRKGRHRSTQASTSQESLDSITRTWQEIQLQAHEINKQPKALESCECQNRLAKQDFRWKIKATQEWCNSNTCQVKPSHGSTCYILNPQNLE